jgi:hypothetical protein
MTGRSDGVVVFASDAEGDRIFLAYAFMENSCLLFYLRAYTLKFCNCEVVRTNE